MYQVAVLQFEGPLDLLLQLVEQSRLAVTTISLAEVTRQYLKHLEQLQDIRPEELNQFLELAARLLQIKSQALLPELPPEAENALDELTEQLANYKQYKQAADQLESLLRAGRRSWQRPPQTLPSELQPLPALQLAQLQRAFTDTMAKLPPAPSIATVDRSVTLEQMMEKLAALEGSTALSTLLLGLTNRYEAVVLFLGILELARMGCLSVSQDKQFDDMILSSESTQPPATT